MTTATLLEPEQIPEPWRARERGVGVGLPRAGGIEGELEHAAGVTSGGVAVDPRARATAPPGSVKRDRPGAFLEVWERHRGA